MERTKNKNTLSTVGKLHVIYLSTIMVLVSGFSIALFTMKSSMPVMAGLPQGHPPLEEGSTQTAAMAQVPGGTEGGGMPPFVKQMVDNYKAAIEKNPEDLEALVGLANMYYDSSQFEKAIPLYETAVKVNPDDNNVKADLGTSYFYSSKSDQAIKIFREVLDKEQNHLNARYNLGVVYKTMGSPEKALQEWKTMMKYVADEADKKKLQEVIDSVEKTTS